MSELEKALNAEEQAKADALLKQFDTRVKTGVTEYIAGSVVPEIEALKKANMTAEERIKRIEEIQRKIDESDAERKSLEQLTYQGIFSDVKSWRHRKGIDQPTSGRIFVAFLNSICNSVDGNMSAKKLAEFETKHGVKYPELADSFKAMGFSKAILSIGSPQEAGFIVPSPLTTEYIEALYAKTYFDKLGVRKLAMPNGNLRMPRVGAKSTATYSGESQKLAKTNPKMEMINWTARKLGGVIAYTRDLFFASPIGIESIIMDDMARVMNLKKEYTALYGTGTSGIPSGLDVLLPNTAGTYRFGSSTTALTRDIPAQLVAQVESTNIVPNLGWLMHPQMFWYLLNLKTTTGAFIYREEMQKGTLCTYPIAKSTQVSFTANATYGSQYGDIWLGNWSEMILAQFRDMEVTVSDQGTFTDDSGNMISCMENDLMMIRFVDQHDFNIRHTEAFIKGIYKLAES